MQWFMESKNNLVRFDEYMCKHKTDSLADSRMWISNSYFGFTNIFNNLHCYFNGFCSEVAHDWSLYLIQQSASSSFCLSFLSSPPYMGMTKGSLKRLICSLAGPFLWPSSPWWKVDVQRSPSRAPTINTLTSLPNHFSREGHQIMCHFYELLVWQTWCCVSPPSSVKCVLFKS